jgi:hypothetical protein
MVFMEIHTTSHPVGTVAVSPTVKLPELETDHSPPSNSEVRNAEPIPLIPLTSTGRGA